MTKNHFVFEDILITQDQFEWAAKKEYQLSKLKILFILYSIIIYTLNTLNE
jgi:hypothetical protein